MSFNFGTEFFCSFIKASNPYTSGQLTQLIVNCGIETVKKYNTVSIKVSHITPELFSFHKILCNRYKATFEIMIKEGIQVGVFISLILFCGYA